MYYLLTVREGGRVAGYATLDNESEAQKLAELLTSAGLTVWIDEREVEPIIIATRD